jgi:hypothetical protein
MHDYAAKSTRNEGARDGEGTEETRKKDASVRREGAMHYRFKSSVRESVVAIIRIGTSDSENPSVYLLEL